MDVHVHHKIYVNDQDMVKSMPQHTILPVHKFV